MVSDSGRARYKFDPVDETWTRTSNTMSHSRWYPTAVYLGDKRVLVVCGHGDGDMDIYSEASDTFTEVTLEELQFRSLYPGLHLMPSDHVFYSRTGWGSPGTGRSPHRRPVRLFHDDRSRLRTVGERRPGAARHRRQDEGDVGDAARRG